MEHSTAFAHISSFTRPNNVAGFPAVGIGKWGKKKSWRSEAFWLS